MAERVGFEPTIPVRAYRFSRAAPSSTRPPLHDEKINLAERERFELSRGITPPYRFSKPAPSTTWVPLLAFIVLKLGGGGGIRTHDIVADITVFKTAAFNHSATPPN